MSKLVIPDLNEIRSLFDWEAVAEAIWESRLGERASYTPDQFINIKEMIMAAADKWLGRDFATLKIVNVEQKGEFENASGYIDVEARIKKDNVSPFNKYEDRTIIIDWKSRHGGLDQRWREKHIDSWQWKIYSSMVTHTPALILYRGVSADYNEECLTAESFCETKEVILVVPPNVKEETEEYFKGIITQRDALIDNGFKVWPRHMPRACSFGYWECPFKDDCDNYTMPKYTPAKRSLSYTSIERFLSCPEFYRRMTEAPKDIDATESSNLGNGVHSGLACLYKQLQKIQA